ncbi:hypothetical protein [Paenibacillus agricola]|uniref:Uncharacterized protein n=1 Tax=Paenibacillus agricola TaxID=2716264 RepID=A0ABX0JL02_9BACL|nr:hypothetical protein [Paenibacillus agricola]NHN34811.1 hypothetical protein [Paenibacillus agricola]
MKHIICYSGGEASAQVAIEVARKYGIFEKAKRAEEIIKYSILKGIYMRELEPMFADMQAAGIQGDEKMKPGTFWSKAKKILGEQPLDDETSGSCEILHQMDLSEFLVFQ